MIASAIVAISQPIVLLNLIFLLNRFFNDSFISLILKFMIVLWCFSESYSPHLSLVNSFLFFERKSYGSRRSWVWAYSDRSFILVWVHYFCKVFSSLLLWPFVLWPLYHPAHMVSRGLASAQCINRHTASCKRKWMVCVNSCLGKMLSVGLGILLLH